MGFRVFMGSVHTKSELASGLDRSGHEAAGLRAGSSCERLSNLCFTATTVQGVCFKYLFIYNTGYAYSHSTSQALFYLDICS